MHFCVLVVGEDPEQMLKPYDENNEGYSEFVSEDEEYRSQWENDEFEAVEIEGKLHCRHGMYIRNLYRDGVPEDKIVKVKAQELWRDYEHFVKDWAAMHIEDGEAGYYTNPNGQWDWYQIGGRWSGFFKLKEESDSATVNDFSWANEERAEEIEEGRGTSQAYKSDIDFEAMKNQRARNAAKFWDSKVAENGVEEFERIKNEGGFVFHGIQENQTREDYIEEAKCFATYAIIDENGWSEEGSVLFFGLLNENKKEWRDSFMEYIEELPDDTLLTIVDCHT